MNPEFGLRFRYHFVKKYPSQKVFEMLKQSENIEGEKLAQDLVSCMFPQDTSSSTNLKKYNSIFL